MSGVSLMRNTIIIFFSPLGLILAQEKITYDEHIFPIFEQTCLNCHNPDKTRGGLDLSTFAGTMKGGSGGKVVDVGDINSSLVTLTKQTAEPIMPPEGDKISPAHIDIIVKWIEGGLLENKSSTARKASKPQFETGLRSDPGAKPDGPPPMPEHLLLEPPVITVAGSAIHALATSPWAPLLAVTGQKQVLLHHTETLELIGILPFPEGDPISLSFTPDARYLIVGGGVPGRSGVTVTFDITNGSRVLTAGREFDSILAADIRPAFDVVATGGPSRLLKLWDSQTGEQLHSIKKHTDWITALDISPDGILLASGDRNGGVWAWEAQTAIEFHTLRAHQAAITKLAFRSDSNLLASASEDGSVRFWEMNNGNEVRKIDAHPGGVTGFAFARDGSFLTAGRDLTARVWKADFAKQYEVKVPALPTSCAVEHDGGKFFVGDIYGQVHVFTSKEGEKLLTIPSNPPSIADRLAMITGAISEHEENCRTSEVRTAQRQEAVAEAKEAMAELRKNHEQAKKIAKASSQGLKDAEAKLEKLLRTEGVENAELEKIKNSLQANDRAASAAKARIESTKKAAEEAEKHLAEAKVALAGDEEETKRARTELANLILRQKHWAAASINTRLLKADSEHIELEMGIEGYLIDLSSGLSELDGPTARLNAKREEWRQFREELDHKRAELSPDRLLEAEATLAALDSSVKNHHDALTRKEREIASLKQSMEDASRSLHAAKLKTGKLRDNYLQALNQ